MQEMLLDFGQATMRLSLGCEAFLPLQASSMVIKKMEGEKLPRKGGDNMLPMNPGGRPT